MKQSILKKPTQTFKDTESIHSSLSNITSNLTGTTLTINNNNNNSSSNHHHVISHTDGANRLHLATATVTAPMSSSSTSTKNVRFLGIDHIQLSDESTTMIKSGRQPQHQQHDEAPTCATVPTAEVVSFVEDDRASSSAVSGDYISFQKSNSFIGTNNSNQNNNGSLTMQSQPSTNSTSMTTNMYNTNSLAQNTNSNNNSSVNMSVYRNYHRKSKTLPVRQVNIFPKMDDDDQLTVYTQQQQQLQQQQQNSLTRLTDSKSYLTPHQQQQQHQYEMLRRTLRISSASIENKTNRTSANNNPFNKNSIELFQNKSNSNGPNQSRAATHNTMILNLRNYTMTGVPTPDSASSTSYYYYNNNKANDQQYNVPSTPASTDIQYMSMSSVNGAMHAPTSSAAAGGSSSTPSALPVKASTIRSRFKNKSNVSSIGTINSASNNQQHQQQQRINSSSSSSSNVYFPSTNQYFSINSRLLSSNTPNTTTPRSQNDLINVADLQSKSSLSFYNGSPNSNNTTSNNNNNGAKGKSGTNTMSSLTLYAYLLQANKNLAKEMKASVIRSQTKKLNGASSTHEDEDIIVDNMNSMGQTRNKHDSVYTSMQRFKTSSQLVANLNKQSDSSNMAPAQPSSSQSYNRCASVVDTSLNSPATSIINRTTKNQHRLINYKLINSKLKN